MAEIFLIKEAGALRPANESDAEALAKLKNGQTYKADIVAPRNLRFHRKSFALLNLAYEYWQPESMIAEVELATIDKLQTYFIGNGVSEEATKNLCQGFIAELEKRRAETISGKDFDAFRAWITVKAGFYQVASSPAGIRKIPLSISFANMDNTEFSNYYKQILNVCWDLCLCRVFINQEAMAEKLLEFE